MKVGDRLRNMMRSFLEIREPEAMSINIDQLYSLEAMFFVNDLWYRGQANELHEFYSQLDDKIGNNSFWASRPTESFNIRKTHSGLPFIIVETFVNITTNDIIEINVKDRQSEWDKIAEDNDFIEKVKDSIRGILSKGDGAFKISYDNSISEYPIIEWWDGDRVDFEIKRGRLIACVFKTKKYHKGREYILKERYSKEGINYSLWCGEKQIPFFDELSEYANDVVNENKFIMALPVKYGHSKLFSNRGEGVINIKIPEFDSLDETISLWRLAVRKGQIKTYIPDNLMPKNVHGGNKSLNYFDNDFIVTERDLTEGIENKITFSRADIPSEALLQKYCNDLDACLCGLISPSTLGIDVKKLDNADSQREKEKTTLYTRGQLIDIYQKALPKLVNIVLMVYDTYQQKSISKTDVDISFGEYANPSFEAVVETMTKARGNNPVMSIEAQVEELWGDSKDREWKEQETQRIKAELGIAQEEEPAVNLDVLLDDEIDINEQ